MTALKVQVGKWSSPTTCLCRCYDIPNTLSCCFGLLHVPFPSLLFLSNTSYRKISRFPWPLNLLKADAFVYETPSYIARLIIGLQCLLQVKMAHTLAACSLWPCSFMWQHCPKMFYNERGTPTCMHARTHTPPPLSLPPSLSVYVTGRGERERKRKEMWSVSCYGITSVTVPTVSLALLCTTATSSSS